MPHNHLNATDLDLKYPSLKAVDDLDMPNLSRLEDEHLYSAGMKVVQDILSEMNQVGRARSCVSTQKNVDSRPVSQSKQRGKGRGY